MALRVLAAQAIGNLHSQRDCDLLLELCADYHCEVRASALHALGLLRPTMQGAKPSSLLEDPLSNKGPALLLRLPQLNAQLPSMTNLAISKLQDPSPEVSITATWMLTLHAPELAKAPLEYWLNHAQADLRYLAAAALSSTGQGGIPLMQHFFHNTQDTFVKMNLAIGLINNRPILPLLPQP